MKSLVSLQDSQINSSICSMRSQVHGRLPQRSQWKASSVDIKKKYRGHCVLPDSWMEDPKDELCELNLRDSNHYIVSSI